jgi:hypothetical protein
MLKTTWSCGFQNQCASNITINDAQSVEHENRSLLVGQRSWLEAPHLYYLSPESPGFPWGPMEAKVPII